MPGNELSIEYKLKKLDPDKVTVTVRITETYQFKVRKYIALRLIRLAGFILGFGINVEDEPCA